MTQLTAKDTITYFISGHLDLTEEEFQTHYVPKLEATITGSDAVAVPVYVVCDARGCDTMAMKWLEARGLGDHVIVYHMFEAPRNTIQQAICCGGFTTDNARDEACTLASSQDVAWVRPGKRGRKSGTMKNLMRRGEQNARIKEEKFKLELESMHPYFVTPNYRCTDWCIYDERLDTYLSEVRLPKEKVERLRDLENEAENIRSELNNLISRQGVEF